MQKKYGYNYFIKSKNLLGRQISKKKFFKKFSIFVLLILQISFSNLFFISPTISQEAQAVETTTMCSAKVDVVLVMDKSGSMDYTSRCDWWQLKCVNPEDSCSLGYKWVQNTTYNQTQSWCSAKNQTSPHEAVYLAISPKKITAAKTSANNFLNLMGLGDQSALVSYANSAALDKGLSNDHSATESAINGLVPIGATNIGDAIKLGINELKSTRASAQAVKAMILLTDGLANRPNGPGYGEYPADVAYAENQAAIAAGLDFKIFTIGLGFDGEINKTMLENIAAATGAEYYYAPTQNDLEAIYNSIATRLCRYGSISGCKYSDANKDGLIADEEKISGWEIKLNNNGLNPQLTDTNGCYQFSGLTPGTYTISEGGKIGVMNFEQTYPLAGSYTINLGEGENIINKDFGNYLPFCGNSLVDGAYGEVCEIGETKSCTAASGSGTQSCQSDCLGWGECVSQEICGNGILDSGEECDGSAPDHYTCTASCTLEYQPYCGDSLVNQSSEECDNNSSSCTTQSGYAGNKICAAGCVFDVCISSESCGDGITNGAEICDDAANNGSYGYCNNSCTGLAPSTCGNNTKEGDEQCDAADGVGANQSCSDTCTLIDEVYCSDGIVNGSETCDDGNTDSGDGCSAVCQTEGGGGLTYGKISGYKYEDQDGLASTTIDRAGLSGWEINLFNQTASTTVQASTTTALDGYFEFGNLSPAAYFLTETMIAGWLNLILPSSPIIILSSEVKTDNDFVNYYTGGTGGGGPICGNGLKEGAEECDGSDGVTSGFNCSSSCVLTADTSGTGGGTITTPSGVGGAVILPQNNASQVSVEPQVLGLKVAPQLVIEKSVGKNLETGLNFYNAGYTYVEYKIIITNNGNLSATNVILNDTLPAGLIYSDDGGTAKTWNLGEIKSGEIKNIAYTVNILPETATGKYINTAMVKADNNDPVTAEAEINVNKPMVAGVKLAGTGFSLPEFIIVLCLFFMLLALIAVIKIKYLKDDDKKQTLFYKTLIFNQDIFSYERANSYFKNRL